MRQSHDRIRAGEPVDESDEDGHRGDPESHRAGENTQTLGDEFDHLSPSSDVEIGKIGRKDDLAGGTDESG